MKKLLLATLLLGASAPLMGMVEEPVADKIEEFKNLMKSVQAAVADEHIVGALCAEYFETLSQSEELHEEIKTRLQGADLLVADDELARDIVRRNGGIDQYYNLAEALLCEGLTPDIKKMASASSILWVKIQTRLINLSGEMRNCRNLLEAKQKNLKISIPSAIQADSSAVARSGVVEETPGRPILKKIGHGLGKKAVAFMTIVAGVLWRLVPALMDHDGSFAVSSSSEPVSFSPSLPDSEDHPMWMIGRWS